VARTFSPLAIVTGASSGIGEALTRQLLDRGWRVIGIARRAGVVHSPGYAHVQLDLENVTGLREALDAKVRPLIPVGEISRLGLVNNAALVALLGQVDQLDPTGMLQAYAVNTVAPVLLMGWVLRQAEPEIPVRLVNVSSGAAVEAFPGLGAYGATKAALRMAGMVLAAELEMRTQSGGPERDVTIWSYEPGVVDTPMQTAVRSSTAETVPIVAIFKQLASAKQLRPAEVPAAEILSYLEADGHPRFSEKRFLLSG
jgi:benzil reductase ((S)-benzoin forming)